MRHIIGITRFGLVGNCAMGEGGFHFPHRKRPDSFKKDRDWVYSAGYLSHRLALWKALALPTIKALRKNLPPGYIYTHLVAVNAELPCHDALAESCHGSPAQLINIEQGRRLEKALDPTIASLATGYEGFFTFRLDDDDALIPRYLHTVSGCWEAGYQVITPVEGYFIGVDRKRAHFPLRMVPAVNAGSPHGIGAFNANIHNFGKHNAIPQTVGVGVGRPFWLRTVHRSNVTLAGHPGSPWGSQGKDVAADIMLPQHFPHLDPSAVHDALLRSPEE